MAAPLSQKMSVRRSSSGLSLQEAAFLNTTESSAGLVPRRVFLTIVKEVLQSIHPKLEQIESDFSDIPDELMSSVYDYYHIFAHHLEISLCKQSIKQVTSESENYKVMVYFARRSVASYQKAEAEYLRIISGRAKSLV